MSLRRRGAVIVAEVERLRWRVWNGRAKNAQRSIERIRKVMHVFQGERGDRTRGVPSGKLWSALHEVDEAAAAHTVFAADPAHPIEIGWENRPELMAWINRKLHRTVSVPDLSAQGYRLIGERVPSTMIGRAAMLVYDDDHGGRITVFPQPMRSDVAPMQPVRAGAANGYAWIDAHMGYGVISDGDTSMHGLADRVRRAMVPEP
jgi:hypothetical protein